jgi:hypothetical protein
MKKSLIEIKFIAIFIFLFLPTSLFAEVEITKDSQYLYIKSDGIPNHKTGQFPGRGNPNSISKQNHQFRVSLNPQKLSRPTPIEMNLFGVALNGVPFDPATAEFWQGDRSSGWNEEGIVDGKKKLGIDWSNGHVQPNGMYHYHASPTGISGSADFIGFAADGFPIYINKSFKSSYQLKIGNRPQNSPSGKYDGTYQADYQFMEKSGDLDICNGIFGKTKEYPSGIYYYVITNQFPMVPRCWVGQADDSFKKLRGQRSNQGLRGGNESARSGMSRGGAPPREAINACLHQSSNMQCSFSGRRGEKLSGKCQDIGSDLACVPTGRNPH